MTGKSEEEQMSMVTGMMLSMIKPLIKEHYGIPQNSSVKEQVDVLANAILKIFPQIAVFLSKEDIQGLLYNAKQTQLDEFYSVVEVALQHRRTE